MDNHNNGAEALVEDPTTPSIEILYEFLDDVIVKESVEPQRLKNIRKGKDHEATCGQQRSRDSSIPTTSLPSPYT